MQSIIKKKHNFEYVSSLAMDTFAVDHDFYAIALDKFSSYEHILISVIIVLHFCNHFL